MQKMDAKREAEVNAKEDVKKDAKVYENMGVKVEENMEIKGGATRVDVQTRCTILSNKLRKIH